ncbi:F-box only protein 47-like [Salvelinus fontinalis]|uniref:F-box only protein 47-like n=1 Tax=Salvelinus fontinalis TaxID=8038 RepID=UPI00248551E0|nr:F-box only protein 47-like [Salvelinus fontinalis]
MAAVTRKFTMTQKFHRRRSHRQPYPVRTITTRSQGMASGCFFERLPAEVFDMVLDRLSVLEISVFSMVSKAISRYIVNHISTQTWRNRMILQKIQHCSSPSSPPPKEDPATLGHYKALGLLFKRCTLLLPTKDRLKFIYSKFSQVPCFMMEQCTASTGCPFFSSYGVFLQALIAGWDELECHRVFNFLCDFTNLPRKIELVVTGKPGACQRLELQIRGFCRQVLLEPWSSRRDTLFWLTRILQSWPMVSQARLLFILYGPRLPDGSLGWQEQLGAGVAQCSLWDLAKAVILLHSDLEARDWTTDTVLAILEELTVLPQAWHVESVARLLILCGNSLCYSILASKALNGRLFEISRLLVYLILVCEKDGYCMNWSVRMVQQVCQVFLSPSDRWSFIQSVENMFSEVTMEMYEVVMAGNRHEDMETFQSLLNASAHFHTEIVYMFLKKD